MANGGWDGTTDEWQRIEQPLLEVDPILDNFAQEFGLRKYKNERDWPSRAFVWGNDDVRCLIQLYLADQEKLTFNLWLCASQDRGAQRFWKREMPLKEERIERFKGQLAEELRTGRRKLVEWSSNPAVLSWQQT